LGIKEGKLLPVKLSREKGLSYFQIINETINANQLYLDPDLSLHNVAQAVNLSDRVVSQSIKQNVRINFSDYINLMRIEYAKDLLRKTTSAEKNILEVLYESGFNSKSVFNSQFKKHTGQSPTEFRRQNK
jgi:AraC-like DNA-binding protein